MPIVVNHDIPADQLIAALAGAAAERIKRANESEDAQNSLRNAQADAVNRHAKLSEQEFQYRQQNDVASRDHADATMRENYRLQQEAADAREARLPEHLRNVARAQDEIQQDQYDNQQNRQIQKFKTQENAILTDPGLTEDERAQAIEENERQRKAFVTGITVKAKSPFPEGRGIGDVWTDPASQAQYSRDNKGDVKLLHKDSDSRDLSDEQFLKHRAQVRQNLTIASGVDTPGKIPTEEEIDAAMDADMTALSRKKQFAKTGQWEPRSAAAGTDKTTKKNPHGLASDPVADHITEQGRQRLAEFIPVDSPLYDVPQGTKFKAGNINGKPGTITAAEIFAACARYHLRVDQLRDLLQLEETPTPPDTQ